MNRPILYADLVDRTLGLSTAFPRGYDFPEILAGDQLTFGLRFVGRDGEALVDEALNLRGMRASIGLVDARPTSGTWRLQYGTGPSTLANTTGDLAYNVSPLALQAALNALTGGPGDFIVWAAPDSMIVRRSGGQACTWIARANRLSPTAFLRVNQYEVDAQWHHELRLTQAPMAWTDQVDEVLPPGPEIVRIQEGYDQGPSGRKWPEIQELQIAREFQGVFQLRFDGARTNYLNNDDDIETIQEELNEAMKDMRSGMGKPLSVSLTLPETGRAMITFSPAGEPFDLIEVAVLRTPKADPVLTLDCHRAAIYAALRDVETIECVLEIEADVWDTPPEGEEPTTWTTRKIATAPITLRRPLIFPELAETPNVDWLRPPSPKDYIPFTPDQVITGSQHYITTLGDGTTTEFVVAHGLATNAVHVTVRENTSGGLVVAPASVRITDANSVTISFATAPDAAEYAVVISSAGPVSAFQSHTHTTGQIVGLDAIIDGLEERLTTVEAVTTANPQNFVATAGGEPMKMELPSYAELYPGRATAPEDASKLDATALPRPGGLLPAIHDATITDLTLPLPAPGPSYTGNVYLNASGADVAIPGGMGRRGSTLKPGEHLACDGRLWYRVAREGSTTSYHPRDFDRELVMLDVNDAMLPVGGVFSLEIDFMAQILRSEILAQWVVIIEVGAFGRVADPAGTNISAITWSATPVIAQPIHLTPILTPHRFGVRFTRGAAAFAGQKKLYGAAWATTTEVPSAPGFAVRARLARFDTEDSLADPRGYVFLNFNPEKKSLATIV